MTIFFEKDYNDIFEPSTNMTHQKSARKEMVELNLEDKQLLLNTKLQINNKNMKSINNKHLNKLPSALLYAVKQRDVQEINIKINKEKMTIILQEKQANNLTQLITDCLREPWDIAVTEINSKLKNRVSSKHEKKCNREKYLHAMSNM